MTLNLQSNLLIINTLNVKPLNPSDFPAAHLLYATTPRDVNTHTTALSEAFQSHLQPNVLTLTVSGSLTCV